MYMIVLDGHLILHHINLKLENRIEILLQYRHPNKSIYYRIVMKIHRFI